jgi:hypothetical protein
MKPFLQGDSVEELINTFYKTADFIQNIGSFVLKLFVFEKPL